MPEGPEIRRITDELNTLVKGAQIVDIILLPPHGGKTNPYIVKSKPMYIDFREKLAKLYQVCLDTNVIVQSIKCKGKFIYWTLYRTDSNRVRFFCNNLGLAGNWRTTPGKHALLMINAIANNKPITLYFDDMLHQSMLQIVGIAELNSILNDMGPDVLSHDFTLDTFRAVCSDYKKNKQSIAQIIINQSFISGIGNYLRADILYTAKIDPHNLLRDIIKHDYISILYDAIYTIVHKSYNLHGTTIKTYKDKDIMPSNEDILLNTGNYKPLIYRQSSINGEIVRHYELAARTVYWVPNVQIL
jgi:formamidopyrimidine-DNA glycosylase